MFPPLRNSPIWGAIYVKTQIRLTKSSSDSRFARVDHSVIDEVACQSKNPPRFSLQIQFHSIPLLFQNKTVSLQTRIDYQLFDYHYMEQKKRLTGEIVLYQPDDTIRLEVRMDDETVWLTQAQIATLFGVKQPAISKHLNNIFRSGELNESSVHSILEYTATDGKLYKTKFYNLDAILSVGYRVNSINATMFRKWANNVLKEYIISGYSVNQRFEQLEKTVNKQGEEIAEIRNKVDFFVQTSLPPRQGVFFDGQIFDAYRFVSDLVRKADRRIVLIDNYVDDTVLALLDKRRKGVSATIYTKSITDQFLLDIKRHNEQYTSIEVKQFNKAHDRFLLIDDEVYHIGASIKDLGKKWFAFALMNDLVADKFLEMLKQ